MDGDKYTNLIIAQVQRLEDKMDKRFDKIDTLYTKVDIRVDKVNNEVQQIKGKQKIYTIVLSSVFAVITSIVTNLFGIKNN